MFNFSDFEDIYQDNTPQEPYPDFFEEWDEALSAGRSPRFLDAEEICEVIDIYLDEGELENARKSIHYALTYYPNDVDMVADILMILNDFEMWEDLLAIANDYQKQADVWIDSHRTCALLHLGMEEDAFAAFRRQQKKYEADKDDLSFLYQAMAEALNDVDLFDAAIDVMEEAIRRLGVQVGFYWLQLRAFVEMDDTEKSLELANQIEHLSPMDGDSWHRLGLLYADDLDAPEKAIDAFEFAESLGYNEPENFIQLIGLYEKYGVYEKALEKLNDYLGRFEANFTIHLMGVAICSKMENWPEALKYLN
ncbi:MAG: tetratricopeptide repeat protein, partial [Dysgonamonadaceae bacterium]|nr:tetratricopeptide repeat protein [Dysgonamonadaceae bacterium]